MYDERTPLQTVVSVELARRGLCQRDLARSLEVPDTSLSDWLRSVHPAPDDLRERIERALGLPTGRLAKREAKMAEAVAAERDSSPDVQRGANAAADGK